ncbi:Inorganic polyphosphate/ATP-NAD kinase [Arcanobacterium haemolyticum]|uniref:NAD kinase n=1 Tax=Arcanobacterium haemolyticum TaxID=28264 RepID=UPI000D84313E|nr:NAD kinase [Arcanobacterium haemolyticum]SPT74352.1 Inorganic polyphosphate/ATP-NAD kinase [Arcanobacterium haemolyticum]
MARNVALLSHDRNPDVIESARRVARALTEAHVEVTWLPTVPWDTVEDDTIAPLQADLSGVDLVVVIGGDGTILRAAELTYGLDVPILGINYGHMGFLAEADPESLDHVISAIRLGEWSVERRMAVSVVIETPDGKESRSWALNEVSIEKDPVSRMVEADIAIDEVPLSAFSCDTVLVSTPTGSTAYSFSAGGPVVWPDVEALVVTPVAAHALFARPLVVGPDSHVSVRINSDNAHVWCDGRRLFSAPAGTRVSVTRDQHRVTLARLNAMPFTYRLVRKFNLPTHGWRYDGENA